MIPTRHKQKLPKTLSWPLGAEAISIGLGDAPHVAELTLWFGDSPVYWQSAFQKILREAKPYAVLVADHTPVEFAAPISGESWTVRINPVPRPTRSVVAGLLRDHGLPAVAEWLRSSDRVGWLDRCRRIELVWSPASGTLSQKLFESTG
jgi:hypothetical protein